MAGRSRALAGVAFVVSLGLAGGAAYALDQATSESGEPTALPSGTPSPTASPTPLPTPSATPSPTASATPSPTPSVTSSPTASPTASPTPRVTVSPTRSTTYPYPKPSVVYSGLEVEAGFNRTTGTPSTVFTLTVKASDGDGKVYVAAIDWEGDGELDAVYPNPTSCKSYPPLTSPPGAYQPAPSEQTFTYKHTYPAGFFQPSVVVRSVNSTCKPNGPAVESSTVRFDDGITVVDPQP